jgi:hypothetical protein
VFQDDEVALTHGADSLSQFQGLYHCNNCYSFTACASISPSQATAAAR